MKIMLTEDQFYEFPSRATGALPDGPELNKWYRDGVRRKNIYIARRGTNRQGFNWEVHELEIIGG